MPENWLLRGLAVALIFGVPAGAIGALTLQRTLKGGFLAGFATGLGSTAADILYACVGVFGVTVVSDTLLRDQNPIRVVGGLFLIGLGVSIFLKRAKEAQTRETTLPLPACFASAFAVAIANPATILAFFTAFAALGIAQKPTTSQSLQLVLGIGLGTAGWWAALSGLAAMFQRKVTATVMIWLNRILGALLMLFGLYACIQTIL